MAVYTLFGQAGAPGSAAADTSNYTMGVQFKVSQAGCTLTGVWFNSATGAASVPSQIALFTAAGTLVHSETASWSGAAASGWVRAAFASPPSLTSGTNYVAAVFDIGGGNWYSATGAYWSTGAGSGGITNGPLSAPNNAGAVNGQSVFNQGGALFFPSSSFNATNYWVDPEVTTAGVNHNATASLTVTPSFSAARTRGRYRTGALTVTPSLSASGKVAAPPPKAGSWWGLDTVFKQSRQEFEAYASRPPMACPHDGEPLRNAPATASGSGVQLYCKYCGWQYPRDYHPPTRP